MTVGTEPTESQPFCCQVARDRHEPLAGTASQVDRWLLVEQNGPWGPEVPPRSRLDDVARTALMRTARRAGARLLFIRRPAPPPDTDRDRRRSLMRRGPRPPVARSVFFADSAVGNERLRHRTVHTDDELAGLRLDDGTGWPAARQPLLLVCTHGRHDRCCSIRGGAVARALAAEFPMLTWESSHIGGDRFAANMLLLPTGQYLGRVPTEQAVAVAAEVLAGRVPLRYDRGRSRVSTVAQAAQYFARMELGRRSLEDLEPGRVERVSSGSWQVTLTGVADTVTVTVRASWSTQRALLSCGADTPRRWPVFELLGLRVIAAG